MARRKLSIKLTNAEFTVARTRAHIIAPVGTRSSGGINFITNKLKSRRRFQRIKWISVIYEERPVRRPDGSSIDRKCPTIELEKKESDAHIGSPGSAAPTNENKTERWRKVANEVSERGKRAESVQPKVCRTFRSLPRARNEHSEENHGLKYSRGEIGIELKSWPSQLKCFAKV